MVTNLESVKHKARPQTAAILTCFHISNLKRLAPMFPPRPALRKRPLKTALWCMPMSVTNASTQQLDNKNYMPPVFTTDQFCSYSSCPNDGLRPFSVASSMSVLRIRISPQSRTPHEALVVLSHTIPPALRRTTPTVGQRSVLGTIILVLLMDIILGLWYRQSAPFEMAIFIAGAMCIAALYRTKYRFRKTGAKQLAQRMGEMLLVNWPEQPPRSPSCRGCRPSAATKAHNNERARYQRGRRELWQPTRKGN